MINRRKSRSEQNKITSLFDRQSRGMTLLEALIALGIFAFMFLFIAQMSRQNYRQAKKMKKKLNVDSSLTHVMDLIRRDFRSVSFFLDVNDNFYTQFPLEEREENDIRLSSSELARNSAKPRSATKNQPPLLSPYFIFEGKHDEIKFVSHTFSTPGPNEENSSGQWLEIRYFIEKCETQEPADSCLMRSTAGQWQMSSEENPEKSLPLLKGFRSLKFAYLSTKNFLDNNWEDQFQVDFLQAENGLSYPRKLPLPALVKIEMEKKGKRREFVFSVGRPRLKAWSSYSKTYPGFPAWKPPGSQTDKPAQFNENPLRK